MPSYMDLERIFILRVIKNIDISNFREVLLGISNVMI